MRQGSAPNFCPPVEEGVTLEFVDERGDAVTLEFLGLVLHGERRYGFFFPVSEDEPAGSSGEVVLLEVTELDEDGQPSAFELVEDEGVAARYMTSWFMAFSRRQTSSSVSAMANMRAVAALIASICRSYSACSIVVPVSRRPVMTLTPVLIYKRVTSCFIRVL